MWIFTRRQKTILKLKECKELHSKSQALIPDNHCSFSESKILADIYEGRSPEKSWFRAIGSSSGRGAQELKMLILVLALFVFPVLFCFHGADLG